jgi:hypothetical protein
MKEDFSNILTAQKCVRKVLLGGALAPNLVFHGAKQEPDPPNHRLESVATKKRSLLFGLRVAG